MTTKEKPEHATPLPPYLRVRSLGIEFRWPVLRATATHYFVGLPDNRRNDIDPTFEDFGGVGPVHSLILHTKSHKRIPRETLDRDGVVEHAGVYWELPDYVAPPREVVMLLATCYRNRGQYESDAAGLRIATQLLHPDRENGNEEAFTAVRRWQEIIREVLKKTKE